MNDTQNSKEKLGARLHEEIKAAHEAIKKPLSPEEVASVVRQVVQSMEGDISPSDLKFYSELEELARYIRQAKHDIASIKPKDISTDFIPTATDELDAVVGATEDATNKIMDECDKLTLLAELCVEDVKTKLTECVTHVYEACNFQDVTGQRITKVVETLKHIDARVEALVRAMGDEIHRGDGGADGRQLRNVHGGDPEKGLLNGPQLPQNAISQDDIDRLLSGG